jgi:hypothetical protein
VQVLQEILSVGSFEAATDTFNLDLKTVASQWYSILKAVPGCQPNAPIDLPLLLLMFLLQHLIQNWKILEENHSLTKRWWCRRSKPLTQIQGDLSCLLLVLLEFQEALFAE